MCPLYIIYYQDPIKGCQSIEGQEEYYDEVILLAQIANQLFLVFWILKFYGSM